MTFPMSFAVPPAGEQGAGSGTSRAFRTAAASAPDAGLAFEMALGAMIAPTPVKAPSAERSIELVLDGEWRLDPEQASGESAPPATGDGAVVAGAGEDAEVVPIGKSLDSWLAAVGRRTGPVGSGVRHGAAEEMVDLVGTVAGQGVEPAPEPAPEPGFHQKVAPEGTVVLPVQRGNAELPVAVPLAARPVTVRQEGSEPEALGADARVVASGGRRIGTAGEETDPAMRRTVPVEPASVVPVATEGASPIFGAGLAHLPPHSLSTGHDGPPSQSEPMHWTQIESGREEAEPVRRAAATARSDDQVVGGRMQLPDEGLDPEALLARYEARHPAVEIGGFAFPLDALDAVADEGLMPGPTRARGEALEGSAYERLRNTTLPALPDGRNPAGGQTYSGSGQHGQESRTSDQRVTRGMPVEEPGSDPATAMTAEPIKVSSRNEPRDPVVSVVPGTNHGATDNGVAEVAVSRPAPTPVAAHDPADRIARRVEHLMLNIADDQGEYGRLKVSVTGTSVRATILPNDPVLAERLTVDLRQLRHQLGERGFADAAVTVQAPRPADAAGQPSGLLVRDVVETAVFDHRLADRPRAEDNRRDTPRDPREQQQQREDQRPSHRSRDQRQEQRGGRR